MRKAITPILLGVLITASAALKAQDNVVKLNLLALGVTNVSLQYERVLGEKTSVALGGSFLIPTSAGAVTGGLDESFTDVSFSGFAFTPEFRLYLGKKEAPRGFYIAPYLRYSSYTLKSNTTFNYVDATTFGTVTESVEYKGSYSLFAVGPMIGAQWLINDAISVDWWIFGFHAGSGTLKGSAEFDFSTLTQSEIDQVINDFAGEDVIVTDDKIEAKIKVPGFGLRVGIAVGYAF